MVYVLSIVSGGTGMSMSWFLSGPAGMVRICQGYICEVGVHIIQEELIVQYIIK